MKRLCLLRHAKSDWSNPALNDFERPLNERGQITASFMADYIAASAWRPDSVLCSTAVRAKETFAPLQKLLGPTAHVAYSDKLYHALPDALLDQVRELAPEKTTTVLVVAHNPGLSLLAAELMPDQSDEALSRGDGVPTGGFLVFELDIQSWRDIGTGAARLLFFGKPKQLMKAAGLPISD